MLMFVTRSTPVSSAVYRLHPELAAAVGFALQAHTPADVLITAIPACQRRRYLAWARRSLRLAGEWPACGTSDAGTGLAACTAASGPIERPGGTGWGGAANTPVRLIAIDDLLPPLLEEQQLDLMLVAAEGAVTPGHWPSLPEPRWPWRSCSNCTRA